MLKPKVYIIILNFNNFEETVQCMNSLKEIIYENYEVVIVDNASKDNSFELLKNKYPNHHVIKAEKNLGYANGNNIGINYAIEKSPDYICILNNDVAVEPDFLNKMVDAMEKDTSIGITGPCVCEYEDRHKIQAMGSSVSLYTGITKGLNKGMEYKMLKKENREVDLIFGACLLCRKEIFEKLLIPENYFLFFEETEFCIKVKKAGYKLLCIYDSVIYHKGSSTIKKYNGLYYFFLNRNRVVFIRRNSSLLQKAFFSLYIFVEALGRMVIRREPFQLIKNILAGFRGDKEEVSMETIKRFI